MSAAQERSRQGEASKVKRGLASPSATIQTSRSSPALLAALAVGIAAATGGVHWPALHAEATAFDDRQYLYENLLVQTPSWGSTWRFLTEVSRPSTVMGYYQPLAMISLMLDSALGGGPGNLLPFHRTSLLLHALNCVLVFLLLHRLFGRPWVAAAVSLLFGLHPMTVEPIPWIGERKTLLASFFALVSLFFYVGYARASVAGAKRKMQFLASLLCYLFALLSKPISVPLVAVLFLLDLWPLARFNKRTILEKLPFLVLAAAFSLITVVSQAQSTGVATSGETSGLRILYIVSHNTIFYLHKIVWPAGLSPHYPMPTPLSPRNATVLAGLLGTAALAVVLILSWRRTRALVVGSLVFFALVFPTMGIIGFTNVLTSDKYAYLPAVGLLLVAAGAIGRFFEPGPGNLPGGARPLVAGIAIGALLVAEAAATRRQVSYWQNSLTLCSRMVALSPNSATVRNLLGTAQSDAGRLQDAEAQFRKAIELDAEHAEAQYNLANTLNKLNRLQEAVQVYQRLLLLRPDLSSARINLGVTLQALRRFPEAQEQFRLGIALKPDAAQYHYLYALCLREGGFPEPAITEYREFIRLLPKGSNAVAAAHSNLAVLLEETGRQDEALESYQVASSLVPTSAMYALNLADAFNDAQRPADALPHYERSLRLKPDGADALTGYGNALLKTNRLEEAANAYRRALQVDPRHLKANVNLATALAQSGRLAEAAQQYRHALELRSDPYIWTRFGNTLEQLSQPESAVRAYEQALQLQPGYEPALQRLRALQSEQPAPGTGSLAPPR